MGDKRYYWLKLKDDFFASKRIKKLRKLAGGDTYTIIYLKMQLLSIKTDGVLEYTGLEQDFASELALDLDEDTENVKVTLSYLASCGLIETSDNINYFLPYAIENTGSESSSAERMREKRALLIPQKANNVAQCANNVQKSDTEIEIDIEIEKSKSRVREESEARDKKTIMSAEQTETITDIIEYLNKATGQHYKTNGQKTISLIKARLKEGFEYLDFKTVIDKKSKQWLNDSKMAQYLRPETLFGTKFEGYLNEVEMSGTNDTKEVVNSWLEHRKNSSAT